MPNPNRFTLSSDFASLANTESLELTLSIPASIILGTTVSTVATTVTKTTSTEAETAQTILARIFSSNDPTAITTGTKALLARTNYEIFCTISSTSTSITVTAMVRNKRTSSTTTGAAETITFQMRPLGPIF